METNKIRVIHANKHALYRVGLRMAIEKRSDLEIMWEAEDGNALLDLLEHNKPDVVVLDIPMPIMDALTVVPLVRGKYPAIKIVILTMYDDPNIIIKMFDLGVHAYLTADISGEAVCEAIMHTHKQGFYISNILRQVYFADLPGVEIAFSIKELELLTMLQHTKVVKELAIQLDLSPRTVSVIIDKLKRKTKKESVEGLIQFALEKGILK